MPTLFWPILSLVTVLAIGYAAVAVATYAARRRLPPLTMPDGEPVPVTPLQRLATQTLWLVLPLALAAAAMVVHHGIAETWANDQVRMPATGLVVAAIAAYAFYGARIAYWSKGDGQQLDERDRAILASAPAGQAGAMLVVLAAWMIGLGEAAQATQTVPVAALYAMFWSVFLTSLIALLVGVVLGYRRS